MMQGILWAGLGTLFTFSITALGALNVFWVKREVSGQLQCVFLGFAAGVMIAASIWSLLLPGIEQANENGQIGWLIISAGFLLGVFLLYGIDRVVRARSKKTPGRQQTLSHSTFLLVLAITIHNIPEGMAVGLAFALAGAQPSDGSLLTGALALALGIGIQNYPEGTAVALPLMQEGMSKKRAFVIGSLSAVVEPISGVLAAILAGWVTSALPLLLALAAGTMIYVVVDELIPQARMIETEKGGTLGFIAGFVVMMILDVAL
jgi:ZIP family zinc transporter